MIKAFFVLAYLAYLALILGLVFWLGPFCINFVLLHTLHHTIPYIWALLLDLVTGGLGTPAAIIVKVLMLLGVSQ